jgi:stearoyl-CoA desaturase (delta-9 desaturase)
MQEVSLRTYRFGTAVPFALIHLGAAAVFFMPFSWRLAGLAALTLWVRMFGVTAGYHRYFAHRSYKLGRVAQFLLAWLAQSSGQKGVLWWAALHRDHHKYSDREEDIHSPWQRGFWWSHAGWVLSNEHDTYDQKRIADFARYPELRWLDRHHWIPTTVLAAALACGGLGAFVWGYLLSTVLLYHFTFAINSLAHIVGTRRFDTPDHSRNNWLLALVTLGEGWHNNHHFSMTSCRQGYRWWEVDITYAVLRVLSLVGIARDLRPFRDPGRAAREAA